MNSFEAQAVCETDWRKALSRYSVVAMFIPLLLPAVLVLGMGFLPGDLAQGEIFRELLQAGRSPWWYKVLMVLDVAVWVAFGGTLLLLGGLFHRHTPIRSAAIWWCSAGMTIGIVTGLLRLAVVGTLAARYATEQTARPELLKEFLSVRMILDLPSQAGTVFGCIGYALAVTSAWSMRGFPRWLAVWIGVPAAASFLQLVSIFAGHGFVLPLVVANNILGYSGLCGAMAVVFWRGGLEVRG